MEYQSRFTTYERNIITYGDKLSVLTIEAGKYIEGVLIEKKQIVLLDKENMDEFDFDCQMINMPCCNPENLGHANIYRIRLTNEDPDDPENLLDGESILCDYIVSENGINGSMFLEEMNYQDTILLANYLENEL